MVYGYPDEQKNYLLERFGFTIGDPWIHVILLGLILAMFTIGLLVIVLKNRRL